MMPPGAHGADLPEAIGTRAGLAGPGGAVPMLVRDRIPRVRTRRERHEELTYPGVRGGRRRLLALGGCATKGDIEQLRSEIAGLRSSIDSIDAKATRAEADAQRAAADAAAAEASAAAASQKADQIFRAGLRK